MIGAVIMITSIASALCIAKCKIMGESCPLMGSKGYSNKAAMCPVHVAKEAAQEQAKQ